MDGFLGDELEKLEIGSIKADHRRLHELDPATTISSDTFDTRSSISFSSSSTRTDPEDLHVVAGIPDIELPELQTPPERSKKKGFLSNFFCRRCKARDYDDLSYTIMRDVTVDSLPQTFLAKYLGRSISQGFRGVKLVRQPIDKLLEAVSKMKSNDDLPLVVMKMSEESIGVSLHPLNQGARIPSFTFPVHLVSYGVQDTRYPRVFCLIFARQIPSGQFVAECHAFVCADSVVARKMALSLSLAYQETQKRLRLGPDCSVDLGAPNEVVHRMLYKEAFEV